MQEKAFLREALWSVAVLRRFHQKIPAALKMGKRSRKVGSLRRRN